MRDAASTDLEQPRRGRSSNRGGSSAWTHGPLALVVGSERHGVSDTWRRAADLAVTIPMPGPVDSLNVATAAGVVLFEAVRQRMPFARPV